MPGCECETTGKPCLPGRQSGMLRVESSADAAGRGLAGRCGAGMWWYGGGRASESVGPPRPRRDGVERRPVHVPR